MSDGNDLSGTIKTSFQAATTEAGALSSKVTQLTAATKAHNAEGEKGGRVTKQMREEMAKAKEEAHELAERFHAAAQAGRMLGGPLGDIVEHLGHMGKLGALNVAGFGAIAVAAGVAGLAFEAYNAILERTSEQLKKVSEASDKYQEMRHTAEENGQANAQAGLRGRDARTALLREGGHEALKRAVTISKDNGLPIDEVRRALVDAYKIRDAATRDKAIQAGVEYAKGGGNMASGVQQIVGNRALQTMLGQQFDNGTTGGVWQVAGMLTHKDMDPKGRLFGGNPINELDYAQHQIAGDRYENQAKKGVGIQNETQDAEEGGVEDGELVEGLERSLLKAQAPMIALLKASNRIQMMQLEALQLQRRLYGGAISVGGGMITNQAAKLDEQIDDLRSNMYQPPVLGQGN